MALARYAAIRLAATVGIAVAVSVAIFASVELLPGDAATTILGQNATPERLEQVRAQLQLDDHPVERYASWLGGVVQGCETIIVSEPMGPRRELALELGATDVIDPIASDDLAAAVRAVAPAGVNYVLDTSGRTSVIGAAVGALAHCGTMGILAVPATAEDQQ